MSDIDKNKKMKADELVTYVVVKESSLKELEIRVNEYHDDGFELAGNLIIVPSQVIVGDKYGKPRGIREYKCRYFQPMQSRGEV